MCVYINKHSDVVLLDSYYIFLRDSCVYAGCKIKAEKRIGMDFNDLSWLKVGTGISKINIGSMSELLTNVSSVKEDYEKEVEEFVDGIKNRSQKVDIQKRKEGPFDWRCYQS